MPRATKRNASFNISLRVLGHTASFCIYIHLSIHLGFPEGSVVENRPANAGGAGETDLIPGSRSPGGGNGNPLQCSCRDNLMDRGAWRAIVQWFAKHARQLATHKSIYVCLSIMYLQFNRQNFISQLYSFINLVSIY